MPGRNECICRGQDLGHLVQAFGVRTKPVIKARVLDGKPTDFRELTNALKLVLMVQADNPLAFRTGLEQKDIHLEECPCSPRYQKKLREQAAS